jgi:hypothetical protein
VPITLTPAVEADEAIRRALDALAAEQRPTGEFPSHASPLGESVEERWEEDTLTFVTALVVLALDRLPDRLRPDPVLAGARRFLRRHQEPGALWRYWAADHERRGFTPPDADDTACCSLALGGEGTAANRPVLLANRDGDGRFYTWLVLHRPWPKDPRAWWRLRHELRARTRRHELWTSTEAEHDDVDGVVNANVLRYLGAEAPSEAVAYVRGLVEAGVEEGCDSWHHSRFALYASIADGRRRGVPGYEGLAPLVEARIAERVLDDGTVGTALDTGHALTTAVDLGCDPALVEALAGGLLASQHDDGRWARSVCYHGGPLEVFGWASTALSTATAAAALGLAHR